jgi:hypothetical protein
VNPLDGWHKIDWAMGHQKSKTPESASYPTLSLARDGHMSDFDFPGVDMALVLPAPLTH